MSHAPPAFSRTIGRVDPLELARGPLARFLAVGLAGLACDALVFSVFHWAGLSRAAARAISLCTATSATWTLNRRFTFPATGRGRRAELARYAAVTLAAQGFSYGVFLTISAALPHVPALIALVTGAVLATGFSFAGQALFTFAALRAPRPG
jgi:putative flippase GtrA